MSILDKLVTLSNDFNTRIKIHRGENASNRGGSYYTTNHDFAKQFTQSGQDHEVKTRYINKTDVHYPNPSVYAGNEKEFDKAIVEAKKHGKKAVSFTEGEGNPNSIYVHDKTALKFNVR